MIVGFIIWSSVAVLLAGIGISTWNSRKPAGFFAGIQPPQVKDVQKYNHSVAILWFIYAVLFGLLGLPLLFLRQNSPGFILSILGVPFITIALVVAYNRILERFKA